MARKKDVWFCQVVQDVLSKEVDITVSTGRVGINTNYPYSIPNKTAAVQEAITAARTLYYNTVLGTNIPLSSKVSTTYQFFSNPRIEIKERHSKPRTIKLTSPPSMIPEVTMSMPYETVNVDRSKKVAEELLDKITTRYAKYIEDEEYWQDVFKQQAEERGNES